MKYRMSGAAISADGVYRYGLWRRWGDGPSMSFVMLNPSTADADADDATIRRCVYFADREGCGGLNVVNLYALRATNPAELQTADDPRGPENDAWLNGRITAASTSSTTLVAAWGASLPCRDAGFEFLRRARRHSAPVWCLGTTKEGHPRHPLYLPSNTPLEELMP